MNTIKRFWTKPPAIFPWVALFHIGAIIFSIVFFSSEPLSSSVWIRFAWLPFYTLAWVFLCDMKKWAGYLYLVITSADLAIQFLLKSYNPDLAQYASLWFPMNVIFTFFILFYFRQLD